MKNTKPPVFGGFVVVFCLNVFYLQIDRMVEDHEHSTTYETVGCLMAESHERLFNTAPRLRGVARDTRLHTKQ
jgi:hypothetical protein